MIPIAAEPLPAPIPEPAPAAPPVEPTPVEEEEPLAQVAPVAEPVSRDPVALAAAASKSLDPFAALDAMIDSAVDRPEEPAPVAVEAPVIAPIAPLPPKESPREADDFHKDPLIQKALEIFSAKIVTP